MYIGEIMSTLDWIRVSGIMGSSTNILYSSNKSCVIFRHQTAGQIHNNMETLRKRGKVHTLGNNRKELHCKVSKSKAIPVTGREGP
jgi:hypothetical protein